MDDRQTAHLGEPGYLTVVESIKGLYAEIGRAQSEVDSLTASLRTVLEDQFADIKNPKELMAKATDLAEQCGMTVSRILKMLGEQINRGDTEVVNSKGERIGVLYTADIFHVGESGEWYCDAQSSVVWGMSDEGILPYDQNREEPEEENDRHGH